jgi:hypothetical protein
VLEDDALIGLRIEGAKVAIQERLKEVAEAFSVSEEAELCSALKKLQRLKAQMVKSA